MTDDGLEALVHDALDAHARAAVPEHTRPPAPRFAASTTDAATDGAVLPLAPHRHRREQAPRRRWLAPVAAAAVVLLGAGVVTAVVGLGSDDGPPAATRVVSSGARNVHVRLFSYDNQTYGVGMPVIAFFSRRVRDARSFQNATTTTVNGRRVDARWYFEDSDQGKGPLEAHLRPENYWPAHSAIHVAIRADGVSAGPGLGFDDDLTLDFRTGARETALVNAQTHRLTLSVDGGPTVMYPVSLGRGNSTLSGRKVVMEHEAVRCIDGPGFHQCHVKDTERLTYGGEFIMPSPRAAAAIKDGRDVSNGATYVTPAAAKALYSTLQVGDVIEYRPDTADAMNLGAGFGDWNVNWTEWESGGAVPTR